MNKQLTDMRVVAVEHIHAAYTLLRVTPADGSALAPCLPGQFVEVRVDTSKSTFLRRPLSINYLDTESNELWLLIRKAGEGTRALCELEPGATLNMVYPLGNGFTMPGSPEADVLLVGGGVGIAPMLCLGAAISRNGGRPEFLIGARSAADLLQADLLARMGTVHVTTDDGSAGVHGLVTAHEALSRRHDMIYCCGPAPMMRGVAACAKATGTPCEVSLENMMACGLGACLCCVEKTVKGNVCVCTEGPVFNIDQLTW